MSIVISAEFWPANGENPCVVVIGPAIRTDQDPSKCPVGFANAKITPVLSGSFAGDGESRSQMCCDGNEKKVTSRRSFLSLNGPRVKNPGYFFGQNRFSTL